MTSDHEDIFNCFAPKLIWISRISPSQKAIREPLTTSTRKLSQLTIPKTAINIGCAFSKHPAHFSKHWIEEVHHPLDLYRNLLQDRNSQWSPYFSPLYLCDRPVSERNESCRAYQQNSSIWQSDCKITERWAASVGRKENNEHPLVRNGFIGYPRSSVQISPSHVGAYDRIEVVYVVRYIREAKNRDGLF